MPPPRPQNPPRHRAGRPPGGPGLAHLAALAPGDVIVYDRGYYSFQLLHAHCERRLHAVFRLQRDANALFREFMLATAATRS